MKRRRSAKAFKIAAFASIGIAAFGLAVQHLWNWLIPSIFGLAAITFWQALGLLALSWLLFGGLRGFRGHGGGPHNRWRRGLLERWEQMTPEERAKFREGIRGGCGPTVTRPVTSV